MLRVSFVPRSLRRGWIRRSCRSSHSMWSRHHTHGSIPQPSDTSLPRPLASGGCLSAGTRVAALYTSRFFKSDTSPPAPAHAHAHAWRAARGGPARSSTAAAVLSEKTTLDGARPGVSPASSRRAVSSAPPGARPSGSGGRALQRRRLIPPPAPTTALSLALADDPDAYEDVHVQQDEDPHESTAPPSWHDTTQHRVSAADAESDSATPTRTHTRRSRTPTSVSADAQARGDAREKHSDNVDAGIVDVSEAAATEEPEDEEEAPMAEVVAGRRERDATTRRASRTLALASARRAAVEPTQLSTMPTALLTNPFRGWHELMVRSYRLDQVLEGARAGDIVLARQEYKSTAFSFMRLPAVPALYENHWAALPQLQSSYAALQAGASASASASASAQLREGEGAKLGRTARRSERGGASGDTETSHTARSVPGLSLFNHQLALDSVRVQCSYPLMIAQRLLLVPDHMRYFHTVCGREGVPCDFFADVDLVGESAEEGERVLLEILNYLEVRLPGVGFTDPFFLILANEVGASDKVSYHIHARSMTFVKERAALPVRRRSGGRVGAGDAVAKVAEEDANDDEMNDDEDDNVPKAAGVTAGVDDDVALGGRRGRRRPRRPRSVTSSSHNSSASCSYGTSSASPRVRVIAFQDYRTVKLLADEVNQTLGRAVIDEGCYRAHGMLRCAFSAKLNSVQDVRRRDAVNDPRRRLMPLLQARDAALQEKLDAMAAVLRRMSDPEILEMTFCTRGVEEPVMQKMAQKHVRECFGASDRMRRHSSSSSSSTSSVQHEPLLLGQNQSSARRSGKDSSSSSSSSAEFTDDDSGGAVHESLAECLRATARHTMKLIRPRHICGPQSAEVREYDSYGNLVSPYLTEAAKWRRFKSVVTKLHTLPPRAAESYDVWVRVGLALHNFSNEDHVFDEWVRFSLKCPQKYSRDMCRKKWVQFERNPDALNWRRGFNYLNSTVWRSV